MVGGVINIKLDEQTTELHKRVKMKLREKNQKLDLAGMLRPIIRDILEDAENQLDKMIDID